MSAATTPTTGTPDAGWYPDPQGSDDLRWWDGRAWTPHMTPAPDAAPAEEPVADEPVAETPALLSSFDWFVKPDGPSARTRSFTWLEPATAAGRAQIAETTSAHSAEPESAEIGPVEPTAQADAQAEPEFVAVVDPEPEAVVVEPLTEPVVEPEPEPKSVAVYEHDSDAVAVVEVETAALAAVEAEPEFVAVVEPEPEVMAPFEDDPEPDVRVRVEVEPEPEVVAAEPQTESVVEIEDARLVAEIEPEQEPEAVALVEVEPELESEAEEDLEPPAELEAFVAVVEPEAEAAEAPQARVPRLSASSIVEPEPEVEALWAIEPEPEMDDIAEAADEPEVPGPFVFRARALSREREVFEAVLPAFYESPLATIASPVLRVEVPVPAEAFVEEREDEDGDEAAPVAATAEMPAVRSRRPRRKRAIAGTGMVAAFAATAALATNLLAGHQDVPKARTGAVPVLSAPEKACMKQWNTTSGGSAAQMRVTLGQFEGALAKVGPVEPLPGTVMSADSCALTVFDPSSDTHAIFLAGVKDTVGYQDATSYPRASSYGWPKSARQANVTIRSDGSIRAF